jgi:hypothetical protein
LGEIVDLNSVSMRLDKTHDQQLRKMCNDAGFAVYAEFDDPNNPHYHLRILDGR